jgi:hypothetical protein
MRQRAQQTRPVPPSAVGLYESRFKHDSSAGGQRRQGAGEGGLLLREKEWTHAKVEPNENLSLPPVASEPRAAPAA